MRIPFKRYRRKELDNIIAQLRNVKDDNGEPVFDVILEGPHPDRKYITLKNWGTTALLEVHIELQDASLYG